MDQMADEEVISGALDKARSALIQQLQAAGIPIELAPVVIGDGGVFVTLIGPEPDRTIDDEADEWGPVIQVVDDSTSGEVGLTPTLAELRAIRDLLDRTIVETERCRAETTIRRTYTPT